MIKSVAKEPIEAIKWNIKMYPINPREGRTEGTGNKTEINKKQIATW